MITPEEARQIAMKRKEAKRLRSPMQRIEDEIIASVMYKELTSCSVTVRDMTEEMIEELEKAGYQVISLGGDDYSISWGKH